MATRYFDMIFILVAFLIVCRCGSCSKNVDQSAGEEFFKSGHTSNWALIIDTSRFWFNYRHISNALAIYRSVKRLGIPDSQIILMLADDMACNPRNAKTARLYNDKHHSIDVYGDDVEVDYRGYEVTVESVIRILTGRLPSSTPRSKRLLTDDRSNILFYINGHGGNGFIKFQDAEEMSNLELADAFEQMWQKRRYHEVFFIADTCEAASLYREFYSPNILAIGSSRTGENSWSHEDDYVLGIGINDQFTFAALQFLEKVDRRSQRTLGAFLKICPVPQCKTPTDYRTDLYKRNPAETLVMEFFGSSRNVELLTTSVRLTDNETSEDVLVDPECMRVDLVDTDFHYANQFPVYSKTAI